ncbi:MAG: hypothetical protein ABIP54_04715, partial [Candidatus Andersenbacteria bacterium]
MSFVGTAVRPGQVASVLGCIGEELGLWSKMLGFLKDRALSTPDIFVCPCCNGEVAPAADNIILGIVDGEIRFIHEDEVSGVTVQSAWTRGQDDDEWKKTLLAYSRDHTINRQALIEQVNAGLTARHVKL